ncbi:MAG: cobalamin-binding protein [Desulfobacteraceae bacterium]|jgi:iron complex transport system substrate-binding protein|nr:MAG: cobalamin-binding protein [Desulfobacteraceae bacterium]
MINLSPWMLFWFLFQVLSIPLHDATAGTFRDALGREVRLAGVPKRIIALAPSVAEILFFLGLGERVAGVTDFSTYPPEAARKPRVGSFVHMNVEKIIDLKPDLVVATAEGNRPELVALLEQARIKTYVVNPRNVAQVIECVREVGRVCGVEERAGALAADLQARVDRVVGKTLLGNRPSVLFQINLRPIMTVNRNTLHHDLIRLAGGKNLFMDEPLTYPRISLEEAIRRRPDVIIISSMERGGRFEEARIEWMRWKAIPAVRDGRVFLIDSDITDRPSPRAFVGIERMARMLHPEAAWD